MDIKFTHNSVPTKDNIAKAIEEYKEIWVKEGSSIVSKIENCSRMKFKTKELTAYIHEGKSMSHPLMLRNDYPYKFKKSILIHELLHILLVDNGAKYQNSVSIHEAIYSYLYDIILSLYGKEFLDEVIKFESDFGEEYKLAWNKIKNNKYILLS